MNYKALTSEEFANYVKTLERQHGKSAWVVATQLEWQRMIAALFDEARPKGRRFQLFTEHAEKTWVPDESKEPRHARDDENGKPVMEQPFKQVSTGGASFQIWEDLNYGTPQRKAPNEEWRGCKMLCPRDVEPEEVEKMMEKAFKDSKNWALKE